ncbi:MAG: hopanoid biosynthesis-associated protein HpnK [Acidobacteria bacterium]|nr:hopanoid biosynthesis-associated protein HpnK [Acidobacteriota bacterium]
MEFGAQPPASTPPPTPIRLIVNADDFGKSETVNRAIVRAHDEGILTSTSLMVTGEACAQAVESARTRPRLAVGLHLVLICGRGALRPSEIPHLVDPKGNFSNDPFTAGVKYYFSNAARAELRREIWAQFELFAATGLPFAHVDGHLHLHMHPVAFSYLLEAARHFGVKRIRLPREPLFSNLKIRRSHLVQKLLHWSVFHLLSRSALKKMARDRFLISDRVYGLLETGRMTEDFWLALLPQLTDAFNEMYCHPEVAEVGADPENAGGSHELAALLSPRIRALLPKYNIQLELNEPL